MTLTGGTLSRAGSGWSTSAVLPPDNGFNSRIDPPSITSTSNLISSTIVLDNATSGSPAAYYPQVQKVYVACFGYPADPAGLVYWASKLSESNGDMKQIINAFGNSSEFVALYAGVNNADKVTMIYERLFNRAPDNAGLDFFTRELNEGRMTAASVALNVANGATGIDATTLSNKLSVASAFTDALATDSTAAVAYSGMFATNLARLMISQVTSLSTTVNPVQETIQAIKKGPLPAQSLNLLDHTSSLSTGHPTDEQVALLWLDSSAEVSALVIGTEASQMSDVYSSADGQASSASLIGSGIQYKEVIA